ncbi:hypothetical protein EKO02_17965 [Enterobacter hormaechei subsp. xiangfangensis]|nr:hypothetical protein EKO02_17965 [Enterobacter hormaechei subsp. xiangfangensis]
MSCKPPKGGFLLPNFRHSPFFRHSASPQTEGITAPRLTVVEFLMVNQVAGGAYTPAMLMGSNLIMQLPGTGPLRIV